VTAIAHFRPLVPREAAVLIASGIVAIPDSTATPDHRSRTRGLYIAVLIAIAAGIVVGLIAPASAAKMKPLGDGFIKLIKMTIAPLIFCTVVGGIAGMRTMKAVGKAGGLAVIYFEVMSTIALVIGLVIVNVVGPGRGVNLDLSTLDTSSVQTYITASKNLSTVAFLLAIIPDTLVGAFTGGDLLPVLLIALLFGFAIQRLGERGQAVLGLIGQIGQVVFGVVGIIMYLAPIGAFGAMAYTVGTFGAKSLLPLLFLMGCFYATCLVFVFGVLGVVARIAGFSIFRFVRYILDEILLVLGTSSSESALPRMMAKLEAAGASEPVVGLVIPAGYSFNLDGTSIYLTMAAVFLAQVTNTPLDIWHQLELLAILLLTSKGAAGVTGSGFIVLAATLGTVGSVPAAALAFIYGIDRFMSEGRSMTNLVGNGVATLVVARWCGELDTDKLHRKLTQPEP
jgi:aerobic C4-dicarboxylate transport protein